MAELDFPADVDGQSVRRPRLRRRLALIALLCVAAGVGIYRVWTGSRRANADRIDRGIRAVLRE